MMRHNPLHIDLYEKSTGEQVHPKQVDNALRSALGYLGYDYDNNSWYLEWMTELSIHGADAANHNRKKSTGPLLIDVKGDGRYKNLDPDETMTFEEKKVYDAYSQYYKDKADALDWVTDHYSLNSAHAPRNNPRKKPVPSRGRKTARSNPVYSNLYDKHTGRSLDSFEVNDMVKEHFSHLPYENEDSFFYEWADELQYATPQEAYNKLAKRASEPLVLFHKGGKYTLTDQSKMTPDVRHAYNEMRDYDNNQLLVIKWIADNFATSKPTTNKANPARDNATFTGGPLIYDTPDQMTALVRHNPVEFTILRKDTKKPESFQNIDANIRRHFPNDWVDPNDLSELDKHLGEEWYYGWFLWLELGHTFKDIVAKIKKAAGMGRNNYSEGPRKGSQEEYYERLIAIYNWLDRKYILRTKHVSLR
jgi:hypothetical protein